MPPFKTEREFMLLENISKRTFQHSYLDENQRIKILELKPGCHLEVSDDIAKLWLQYGGVREYVDPAISRAKEEVLKAQIEALKQENEALKEKEEVKKATKKNTKKSNKK